jgi:hypothetical protein
MSNFRGTCCLHIQTALKMEAVCFFEMLVLIYENTRRHIPEDNNIHVLYDVFISYWPPGLFIAYTIMNLKAISLTDYI